MTCPICGARSNAVIDAPAQGLAVDCPTHGTFLVAQSALRRFEKLDRGAKELAHQKARVFAADRGGEVIITKLDL